MTLRPVFSLVAVLALGACVSIPDMRRGTFGGRVGGGAGAGATPAAPSAAAAESTCLSAARDAGFTVQGVVGSQDSVAAGTTGATRDVMLRISSGGRTLDLRCVYAYDTQSARIMTL